MSEFINTVDVIGDEELCNRIISRTVTEYKDNGVTGIGSYAFRDCTRLTSIDIPAVTTIDSNAFSNCTGLTSVDLPAVNSIGMSAFYNCGGLTSVDIPAVTHIDRLAFYNCIGLTSVDIPAVTEIGMYAFEKCTGLSSITFKSTPKSIHIGAFSGCNNLLTINVPWASGAVSGAPWGATKATINYNYTGV